MSGKLQLLFPNPRTYPETLFIFFFFRRCSQIAPPTFRNEGLVQLVRPFISPTGASVLFIRTSIRYDHLSPCPPFQTFMGGHKSVWPVHETNRTVLFFFERPGTCCYYFILMNVRIYLFTMIRTGVCNSSSLSYYTGPLHYVVFLFQSCSERNKPTMCLPNPQLYFADSLILKCIPLLEPYFETWNCRRAHVFP